MPRKKTQLQIAQRKPVERGDKPGASGKQNAHGREAGGKTKLVSGRWLLTAVCGALAAAAICGWLALCLLFWQGSWELLYHPSAAIARTPASAGLAFDAVAFAATDTGAPRLKGWWIPAARGGRMGRLTVVYLDGRDGNMGDTVDALAALNEAGANVLAFDYRGYGESQFARPSEQSRVEDAEWAIDYLTGTRQISAGSIVLGGEGLGANLALEVAAKHAELAGVIVDAPTANATAAIFNDARARLVPARLLVRDRYDLNAAAGAVRVPVLWLERADAAGAEPDAYRKIAAPKMLVWVNPEADEYKQREDALSRWLDGLGAR